jgi:uncharacterized protein
MVSNSKSETINEVVVKGISSMVKKNQTWTGTMTYLGKELSKNSTVLPGSPSALRVVLNRVVNRLRTRGISVKFIRTPDKMRTRQVRFSR